jgi:hypothetical protein
MKTTPLILSAVALVAGAVLVPTAISVQRTNARLRGEVQTLRTDLEEARHRATILAGEKVNQETQLKTLAARHGDLTARISELEAAEAEKLAFSTSAAALKPYRAEAYLGRQSIGPVWIVPRNARLDSASQRYVYEPTVCLDDKLRRLFEVHHTNTVERTVEVPVYVNNNYYPEPYYYYPAYYSPGICPTNSRPPIRPQPVTSPAPFNPGNGTIIKQPILTPAERIRTTPTAPRTPLLPPNTVQPRAPITTPGSTLGTVKF